MRMLERWRRGRRCLGWGGLGNGGDGRRLGKGALLERGELVLDPGKRSRQGRLLAAKGLEELSIVGSHAATTMSLPERGTRVGVESRNGCYDAHFLNAAALPTLCSLGAECPRDDCWLPSGQRLRWADRRFPADTPYGCPWSEARRSRFRWPRGATLRFVGRPIPKGERNRPDGRGRSIFTIASLDSHPARHAFKGEPARGPSTLPKGQ